MAAGVVDDQLPARNTGAREFSCGKRVEQIILGRDNQGGAVISSKGKGWRSGALSIFMPGKPLETGSSLCTMAITRFRSCAGAASTTSGGTPRKQTRCHESPRHLSGAQR